jgi:glycosyltransferase involved in cell wall biosynthesis
MTIEPSTSKPSLRVLNAQPDDLVMGGVQMRSVSVGKRLLDHGVQTDILVPTNPDKPVGGPVSTAAREEGLRVFEYQGLHRPRAFRNVESILHNLEWVFSFPIAVARVCDCIQRADPDIVHVNGLLNLIPAVAARLTGRRLLWHLIGDHYPKSVVRVLRPVVVWLADEIAVLSGRMRKYYFGGKKVDSILLHEPVDLERFDVEEGKAPRLLDEFGTEASQPVVGSVGKISPAKGWLHFLDAVHELVKDEPDLHALIIGPVPDTQQEYAEKVKRRIQDLGLEEHVTLTGYRTDVDDLLGLVDIFMMASLNEGTPLAILEAMGAGIPIVATDVGGVAEQVVHGETGYVCPPKEASALHKACRCLLEEPGLRREMGKAGRRRAEGVFSLESSVEQHISVYECIV